MTPRPNIYLRNVEYRSYSLQLNKGEHQWEVEIAPARADLPDLPGEKRTVRGWDQEEVLERAKSRVDDLLENLPPN